MPDVTTAVDAGRLRVVIVRLARELRRHSFAGLTPTQASALATVDRCGPLRLGDLAASEGITPSTLTRLVAVLEERGYLARRSVPGDARSSTVATTPSGHLLLERLREESTSIVAERMALLDGHQRAALAEALPTLERLADIPPS